MHTYIYIVIHIQHSGRLYIRYPLSHFKVMTSAIEDIVSLFCNILVLFFKMDGKHVTRMGDHNFKSVDHLNARFEYCNGWFGFITATGINIYFFQSSEYDLQIIHLDKSSYQTMSSSN